MELLRYGAAGTAVQYAQLALLRAGFKPLKKDGIFGARTQDAVRQFQKQNRLAPDGVVGKQTWNALYPYLKGYTTHTIQSGDTLFSLAASYRTQLYRILLANPTVQPQNLTVGTRLQIPFDFSLVPTDVPYSSALNGWIFEGLSVRYPFLKTGTVGKSVMGRPLLFLRLGVGEKEVFYNAAHHANEWITTPVLLKFAEQYAESYALGETLDAVPAAQLFQEYSLYILPMVDPDGVDLVTGMLKSGGFYNRALQIAARYPEIPFPNGWKANLDGVDLNLQYPAGWEQAKEIKFAQGFRTPAPRDFVGASPLSAPESLAVSRFTQAHRFLLTLSYHSQGELIYWKYADFIPPQSLEIAEAFHEVSGYTVAETPYASGFAGYKDWFIESTNRPAYTIEVGRGQSPLPLEQFDKIYADNFGILLLGMTELQESEPPAL